MGMSQKAKRYWAFRLAALRRFKQKGKERGYADAKKGMFDPCLEGVVADYVNALSSPAGISPSYLLSGDQIMNAYWEGIKQTNPSLFRPDDRSGLFPEIGRYYLEGWCDGVCEYLAAVSSE